MSDFDPLRTEAAGIVYLDFKSPYAYLAIDPMRAIEKELGIEVEWRPLTLDIPSYLGSAKLDAQGNVAEQNRSEEQWAAVKYAYRDCRRYAKLKDRVLRGTIKIWDTSLAHIGFEWAKRHDRATLDRYIDLFTIPFWRREVDAEDAQVVAALLREAGAPLDGFDSFRHGEGRQQHDQEQEAIFEAGVFGVPSFVVGDEMLFGRENLPRVRWLLAGATGPSPDVGYRRFDDGASA